MGRRPKYDWPMLKLEYTTGTTPTYEALSNKHGIPLKLVERHGATEKWVQQKKVGAERVLAQAIEGITNADARAIENLLRLKQVFGSGLLRMALDALQPGDPTKGMKPANIEEAMMIAKMGDSMTADVLKAVAAVQKAEPSSVTINAPTASTVSVAQFLHAMSKTKPVKKVRVIEGKVK